jgi:hypothetical protein
MGLVGIADGDLRVYNMGCAFVSDVHSTQHTIFEVASVSLHPSLATS